jgi:hypothetical protein
MDAKAFRAARDDLMRRKGPAVSVRQLWEQAVRDWTDKEVQRTYTTTYIWMTNQLGHFTLGFLVTFLFGWFVVFFWGPFPREEFVCGGMLAIPAGQLLFWIGKEVWDYLRTEKATDGADFPFDNWAVAYNVATAVGFILAGIVVAYLSFISLRWALIAFAVGLLLALLPAKYWLSRKLCFQQAALPYLSRLADFKGGSFGSPENGSPPKNVNKDVDAIVGFLFSQNDFRHLFIFGAAGTGRTTLAVAIGTERTFAVRRARYMSWSKFAENAQRPEPAVQDGMHVWPWRESDIVILDDVVKVVNKESTPVRQIVADLNGLCTGVRRQLVCHQTVWVLGPEPDGWVEELAKALDVSLEECCKVHLMAWNYQKPKAPFSRWSGT